MRTRAAPTTRALAGSACLVVSLLALATAAPAGAKDGRGDGRAERLEARAVGRCGPGATSRIRLRAEEGVIEVTFEVDHTRSNVRWRVAIVHERRVAFRGAARTSGAGASLEVERDVPDLPGADAVTARGWGPRGLTCVATARLPG